MSQPSAPQLSPLDRHPGTPFSTQSPHYGPIPQSVSLPPLQLSRTPPILPSDRRHGNPLGVHSMLNPQAEATDLSGHGRRSGSQMETPSPVESQQSRSLTTASRPPSADSFQQPGRPAMKTTGTSPTFPRNPGITYGHPTGSIDAFQSPFLPSAAPRAHAPVPIHPHTSVPSSIGHRGYAPPILPTAPTPPPPMPTHEMRRASVTFPQSGAASPLASYSSYGQSSSVGSGQIENPNHQGGYPSTANANHPAIKREFSNPPIAMETERALIPMHPSGHGTIQMLTVTSHQGHQVQIPVDVQAASKSADEKRKRNAGASARFRQRRKEKEIQASVCISRLEHQLRDALEDVNFYREERDHFRTMLQQHVPPSEQNHHTRPASPRLRRTSIAPSSAGGGDSMSSFSTCDDAGESERNVRRRTSSYHPVSGPPPAHHNGTTTHPPTYPSGYATGHLQHAQPPYGSQQQPPPNNPLAPSQRPILRNPFAADSNRYETGHFAPGSGRA
ncbi:hypothetical protein M011DRAFT_393902 [Sporormia fimetaria CBS 119925]|uniref:BZIP domain-containing protein n=1 Tax=Sporormia fimetaria CBS 119925 TaxID=1340428 RepID=A0A6A6VQI3_9PLEO|nr:hypothetical protein M011DRAFT_393902 [Sporormia fimetaria CBS 119925]